MLEKINDNIQKLTVTFPMGMGDVNSYLIEGKNGYTVIDTGADLEEAKKLWKDLLDTGIKIEKVVITHTHEDHVGLAKWFQEYVGVPVIIPRLGIEEMRKKRNYSDRAFAEFITRYGGPEPESDFLGDPKIYDFTPDDTFENNEVLLLGDDPYETIWTPGHSYDQFCFYNSDKNIMIVGDHILKEVSPIVGVWNREDRNPLIDYFQSLKTIKKYSPNIALTGHGEPIYSFQNRVEELQERHQQRLKQLYEMVNQEYKSVTQICEEIYGTLNIIINLSAFMATLTRLLYLEEVGKVGSKVVDGTVVFKAIHVKDGAYQ